jgi:hypothetical protein
MKRFPFIWARSLTASVAGLLVAILSATFWIVSAAAGGSPTDCTVCHKRTQTITLGCNTLEYRRHLDHGDAMGACAVTPTDNP